MVAKTATAPELIVKQIDQGFLLKVFFAFASMAAIALAISVVGRWTGREIALAGHTADRTVHEVVIGNNVIAAPANTIRFERERRSGVTEALRLYLRWPDMQGYSDAVRDDFNHEHGSRRILFLTFEPRMMSRDMSGRYAPIYSQLVEEPGVPTAGGVVLKPFTAKSGYMNEVLAVAERSGGTPFVARCLTGPTAQESLASCERDIHIGNDLSLSYRFPEAMLPHWRELDQRVRETADSMLRTAP